MKCHPYGNIIRCKGVTDLNGVLLKISDVHSYVIDMEKQRNSKVQPNYQIKCYKVCITTPNTYKEATKGILKFVVVASLPSLIDMSV